MIVELLYALTAYSILSFSLHPTNVGEGAANAFTIGFINAATEESQRDNESGV